MFPRTGIFLFVSDHFTRFCFFYIGDYILHGFLGELELGCVFAGDLLGI